MFHFPWPKRAKPSLVDKLCEQAVEIALLRDSNRRRPRRERRRDAADIIAARINTTEALRKAVGWE